MSRIHYKRYQWITALARELRSNLTPSERILWERLRDRKFCGYKFLRQHPVFYRIDKTWVEFFIVDFYCSELKLIIEVDGPIHDFQTEKDGERDLKLNQRGYYVKRIKNEELINPELVISDLRSMISEIIRV